MTIEFALLGLLLSCPMSGYDMKKKMQDTPFIYWSGNNNQIYKALVQLSDQGYVTNQVEHQDGAPSKKIYSITPAGRFALKEWMVTAEAEMPETKSPFLIRFAFSQELSHENREQLLAEYEEGIKGQQMLAAEKKRRAKDGSDSAQTEQVLWELSYDYLLMSYEAELAWVKHTRAALQKMKEK